MFLNNKYTHWYEAIIKNCCSRHEGNFPDGYYEEHHIVPKSLGGSNERKISSSLPPASISYVISYL